MRSAPRTDSNAASRKRRRQRRHAPWGVRGVAVCLLVACSIASAGEPFVARFRVEIDSPKPVAWRGELSVTGGSLEQLQPLSLDPAAAAGSSLDKGRVRLHHRSAMARDVFDVTVRATDEDALQLKLADSDSAAATIPLTQARIATPATRLTVPLGESGATVTLSRLPADRIRLEAPRESFVFQPSERFACDVLLEPEGLQPGDEFDFVAALSRGRSGAEVWRSEPSRVAVGPTGVAKSLVELTLPTTEGVYRLTLTAKKPAGFRTKFLPTSPLLNNSDSPLAQRTVQLAVFDPQRRPLRPGDWLEAYAFDPRSVGWADRLPERMRWRRLPWFAAGPRSSEEGVDAPHDGAIEIAPSPGDGRVHWRAYPLSVDQPGGTYAVEVETLGAPGDMLTIAVLEPDALGDLRPISGVVTHVTPRWNRDGDSTPAKLLIRPRTNSPLLVLSNPSEETVARFGRVRLLKSRGIEALTPATERLATGRIIALDWPEANLSHALGASHVRSELGAFEQPDLVTYWETATALADRVQAAGASAAAVPVNQSGGALYPSRLWTTPRYDLGVWSDGSADTPRRELLHLIALELDRRGLQLLPVLRFDAPTPIIEHRNGSYDAAGSDAAVARRLAVEEVLDTVGKRDVIAGVAIRLTPGSWALRHPSAADSVEGVDPLVAAYDELARAASDMVGRPLPLVILSSELTTAPEVSRHLLPKLGASADGASAYIAKSGLTSVASHSTATIVSAPFGAVAPEARQRGDLATDIVLTGLRRSLPVEVGRIARSLRTSNFPLRLIESEKRLRGAGGSTLGEILLPAIAVAPTAEPALLASAIDDGVRIVTLDGEASAGWLDDAAIERRQLHAAIPALPAPESQTAADLATSRDINAYAYDIRDSGSLAIVTNQSAWSRRAQVTIQTPQRLRGLAVNPTSLATPLAVAGQWFDAGEHVLDLELAPYQSAAWRFAASGVRVTGVRVDPEPAALRELAEGLADLQSRDTTKRRPFARVLNPSFEERQTGVDDGSQPVGWRLGEGASVDSTVAADGATSVRMQATANQPATLSSETFAAPSTGQLALGLRVLPHELQPGCELRIELEQVDGPYRNHARAASDRLSPPTGDASTSAKWLPIVFPMDDLPLGTPGEMRLRFTLVGDGELSIDDLRPEDLVLPLDGQGGIDMRAERFAIVRLLQTSQTLLDEGRLEACRTQLDSYWARFLIENYPRREASSTVVNESAPTKPPQDATPEEEATPTLSERLRGYMPRWWR
ncbi:hypothetical protein [Botrimarina mediterranea]|uniref:hypothetical protein n=1 Tax=Botrimarina mediterranea TaxID=2528022 RepID=UPI00118AFE06|nr:hypothetical protein K2D_15460 [Planctomycetes bacterium K2D]